jgi:regulator of replication initiation timing
MTTDELIAEARSGRNVHPDKLVLLLADALEEMQKIADSLRADWTKAVMHLTELDAENANLKLEVEHLMKNVAFRVKDQTRAHNERDALKRRLEETEKVIDRIHLMASTECNEGSEGSLTWQIEADARDALAALREGEPEGEVRPMTAEQALIDSLSAKVRELAARLGEAIGALRLWAHAMNAPPEDVNPALAAEAEAATKAALREGEVRE